MINFGSILGGAAGGAGAGSSFGPIGTAVGAGVGLLGGILGGGGSDAAAQGYGSGQKTDWWAMANTSNAVSEAMNAYENAYQTSKGYLYPYWQGGMQGENALTAALTPAGGMTQQDMVSGLPPGAANNLMDFLTKTQAYQFPLQQGAQLLQQSAAARGNALSPGTLQALTQYGQNYAASNALAPSQANYQNYLKNIAGLAGTGMQAGTQLGNWAFQNAAGISGAAMGGAGMQNTLAQNIAGLQGQQGLAQQSSDLYRQNSLSSLLGSAGGLIANLPWNQIGNSLGVGSSYGGGTPFNVSGSDVTSGPFQKF